METSLKTNKETTNLSLLPLAKKHKLKEADAPWLPEVYVKDSSPLHVRTAGMPWLYGNFQWGHRSGFETVVFTSTNGLMYGAVGAISVYIIPTASLLEKGSNTASMHSMLSLLAPAEA